MNQLPSKIFNKTDEYLLVCILLVAGIFRLYNIAYFPFFNEELNALQACSGSLKELFTSIKADENQPFLSYLFIHVFSGIFEDNHLLLRLPFMLMGLASLVFIFENARILFNSYVALCVVSLMALMQSVVAAQQMIGPAAPGMLFTSLTIWCWLQYFYYERPNRFFYTGVFLFGILAAFTHHFAFLFILSFLVAGLLYKRSKDLSKHLYIIAGVVICYLLLITTSLSQLPFESKWVDEYYGPFFIIDFVRYLFHYSVIQYIVVTLLICAGFLFYNRIRGKAIRPLRIWCLCVFFIPFLLGDIYSRIIYPTLTPEHLIFGVPFLLMAGFSFFPDLGNTAKRITVFILLVSTGTTLLLNRDYYSITEQQGMSALSERMKNDEEKYSSKEITHLTNVPSHESMKQHYPVSNRVIHYSSRDLLNKPFRNNLVNNIHTDLISYSWSGVRPWKEQIGIIKETHPYLIGYENGYDYEYFLFSKNRKYEEKKLPVLFHNNSINIPHDRQTVINKISWEEKANNKKSVKLLPELDFFPLDQVNQKNTISDEDFFIEVSFDVEIDNIESEAMLVLDVRDRLGQALVWRGLYLSNFVEKANEKKKVHNMLTVTRDHLTHNDVFIKAYIWNKKKDTSITLENYSMKITACAEHIKDFDIPLLNPAIP